MNMEHLRPAPPTTVPSRPWGLPSRHTSLYRCLHDDTGMMPPCQPQQRVGILLVMPNSGPPVWCVCPDRCSQQFKDKKALKTERRLRHSRAHNAKRCLSTCSRRLMHSPSGGRKCLARAVAAAAAATIFGARLCGACTLKISCV